MCVLQQVQCIFLKHIDDSIVISWCLIIYTLSHDNLHQLFKRITNTKFSHKFTSTLRSTCSDGQVLLVLTVYFHISMSFLRSEPERISYVFHSMNNYPTIFCSDASVASVTAKGLGSRVKVLLHAAEPHRSSYYYYLTAR